MWYPEQYNYSAKCAIYKDHGFAVAPRVDKFTGFEKVRFYYDLAFGTGWGTGFDKAFRKPMEIMNPAPSKFRQRVPVGHLRQRHQVGPIDSHP